MSTKIKVVISIILLTLLSGVFFTTYEKQPSTTKVSVVEQPRDLLTINDVLTKPKEKIDLIDKINPKEQYAIGVIVQLTPLAERDNLKTKKLSEIISIYEEKTGEKVPFGEIKDARLLKHKELSMESSKILFALTIPEEDKSIMEIYMAKRFLNSEKMKEINNQTVGQIIDNAKIEMPGLYEKLIAYSKLKKKNESNIKETN